VPGRGARERRRDERRAWRERRAAPVDLARMRRLAAGLLRSPDPDLVDEVVAAAAERFARLTRPRPPLPATEELALQCVRWAWRDVRTARWRAWTARPRGERGPKPGAKSIHWRDDPAIVERVAEVVRRRNAGETIPVVARALGVTARTVSNDLWRAAEVRDEAGG
jgi:hypothetical protein